MFVMAEPTAKSEYVYALTTEGVGVYHVAKERIGQNMLEKIKDPKGNYTWKDILATVKKNPGGDFLTTWTARGQGRKRLSRSWVTSSHLNRGHGCLVHGVYVDDINAELSDRLNFHLAIAGVLVVLIAGLGFVNCARGFAPGWRRTFGRHRLHVARLPLVI